MRQVQQDACIRREGFTGAIIAILWLNMAGSAIYFWAQTEVDGLVGTFEK